MPQPNFILILADDMGYSDIGCFGSEIQTPNLDRLAGNGARFSQMYSFARCCPSRARPADRTAPAASRRRSLWCRTAVRAPIKVTCVMTPVTIAEVLKGAGYQTMMSSKWHVGGQLKAQEPETWQPGTDGFPTPRQRGFDRFYGTLVGAGSFFFPHALSEDDALIGDYSDDFYYTDAISDKAVEMIAERAWRQLTLLPACCLYRASLAAACPATRYRRIRRQISRWLGYAAAEPARGTQQPRHPRPRTGRSRRAMLNLHPWEAEANTDWEDLRMATYAA